MQYGFTVPPFSDFFDPRTAIALRTSRLRIGALVTPLPRRRPVKFAREAVSLDHVSDGRLVVGVGSAATTRLSAIQLRVRGRQFRLDLVSAGVLPVLDDLVPLIK